ncbi:MAG: type II toxin-antitoxin system VapC family toxin [Deltaproteobacteria bacterium]|nr:type II toxin-antitoxin system VapC family toxin [Deltaproteobacteria bacterium]
MTGNAIVYLLDTDTCVFALRHRDCVLRRLRPLSPDDVAVATMTEAEPLFGALGSRDPARARTSVLAFLEPIARLPFDSAAAEQHARIRYDLRPQPIGERDAVIAATALAGALIVVTHNTREFARVAGLAHEDWVEPG